MSPALRGCVKCHTLGIRVGSKTLYPNSGRWLAGDDERREDLCAMNNKSTTKGAQPVDVDPSDGASAPSNKDLL
jgi:hypothetical protein